ncbi:MAG: homoserine dehydrogenase [Chryseobacterium sp.]|nr:MAG: homoserine dehydrogenase [Chryseobacterium sp.]
MNKKKPVQLLRDKAIIRFEGKDFLGEVGVDGRIFRSLTYARISVGLIVQQVAEKGISVLVNSHVADDAVACLTKEFAAELASGAVSQIFHISGVSVISFATDDFPQLMAELARNSIYPMLLNRSGADRQLNIVVGAGQDQKAVNIIEAEISAKPKTVHLAVLGNGRVGSALIDQVLSSAEEIRQRKKLDLKIIAVADSKEIVLDKNGFGSRWKEEAESMPTASAAEAVIRFGRLHQLENLIAVDVTTSVDVAEKYPLLAENGFDLVSSNKSYNVLPIGGYRDLRQILRKHNRRYLYETNVGAGLPLIDTIKLLHLSGENITRIRGVFSGSLSYIFNHFSAGNLPFSQVVNGAVKRGLTHEDLREDLSGKDVARKLLVLARELDLANELKDVRIDSFLPKRLLNCNAEEFEQSLQKADEHLEELKQNQQPGHVLRYIGDLHGDLHGDKGLMDVALHSVPVMSSFGRLSGSDSLFEIYTESYGENPITIIGAGAGAQVTARGVFGDILRISETK